MELRQLKREIPDIFERVKSDVKRVLNRSRAGLNLGLVDMGISPQGFIGGMFFSGGTMILMNVRALKVLIDELNSKKQQRGIIRDYVYHVLMHEYIHSLGFLDETTCREITLHVTSKIYPESHPVHVMAKKGIGVYFPRMIYAPEGYSFTPRDGTIELVRGFDRSNTTYYM